VTCLASGVRPPADLARRLTPELLAGLPGAPLILTLLRGDTPTPEQQGIVAGILARNSGTEWTEADFLAAVRSLEDRDRRRRLAQLQAEIRRAETTGDGAYLSVLLKEKERLSRPMNTEEMSHG